MKRECQDIISSCLGVEPIEINSALVSAQQRKRLYWTNIEGVSQPEDKAISFQDIKSTKEEYCDKFIVKRTKSREKMWGDGLCGKCKNVTFAGKIDCLTQKQDRWGNSGLVEYKDFCRYLTTEELEQAQTLPVGYTIGLSKNQSEKALGNAWTVDVIAHIFKGLKGMVKNGKT